MSDEPIAATELIGGAVAGIGTTLLAVVGYLKTRRDTLKEEHDLKIISLKAAELRLDAEHAARLKSFEEDSALDIEDIVVAEVTRLLPQAILDVQNAEIARLATLREQEETIAASVVELLRERKLLEGKDG